eukprot:TRINITY_DN4945_c0_g1_i1.p2 TRINITY_DN4945_c0_g1~~TRINITY_DN4945_c0_g1_i1.p2  ORF type:complete len:173 (-),score=34.49 TRINITY_DN4945_c0_g1_i1:146-664(-)
MPPMQPSVMLRMVAAWRPAPLARSTQRWASSMVGADTATAKTAPFHDAVEEGDLANIKGWIEKLPVDVNSRDPGRAGVTPMHIACRRGLVDVVQALHEAGAQLDATGPWGMTPLQYSTVFGHREVVRLLLELGADVQIQDQTGKTALEHAVVEQQVEIAEDLNSWVRGNALK